MGNLVFSTKIDKEAEKEPVVDLRGVMSDKSQSDDQLVDFRSKNDADNLVLSVENRKTSDNQLFFRLSGLGFAKITQKQALGGKNLIADLISVDESSFLK